MFGVSRGGGAWLEQYKRDHAGLIQRDPTFGQWLEEEYVPLVGGWLY
jgi:hypothetical protein